MDSTCLCKKSLRRGYLSGEFSDQAFGDWEGQVGFQGANDNREFLEGWLSTKSTARGDRESPLRSGLISFRGRSRAEKNSIGFQLLHFAPKNLLSGTKKLFTEGKTQCKMEILSGGPHNHADTFCARGMLRMGKEYLKRLFAYQTINQEARFIGRYS